MFRNDDFFRDESKRSLLIITDDREKLKDLSEVLEADYEVFFVEDEKVSDENNYSALMVDMDQRGARKIIKGLKENHRFNDVPLILVSKDPQTEKSAHYLGADEVILLPCDNMEQLLYRIKRRILSYDGENSFYIAQNRYYQKDSFYQRIDEELHRALNNDEIKVYYQPKYNIRFDVPVLCSAEALVRWHHPQKGLLMPDAFIPLLEEKGKIFDLDSYVWLKAAMQVKKWKEKLKITVPVSVNVSKGDLKSDVSIWYLENLIKEAGISHDELLLEITESVYDDHEKALRDRINALRDLGFLIEMDDFGTGYSSLSLAKKLPIDAMKIDMRFVKDAFQAKKDTGMIEIILKICDYLKVLSIAEGVENKGQLLSLKQLGCDIVQGYYFSKPVCAEDFEKFLCEKMEILGP